MKKSLIILSFVVAMLLPLTTRAQVTCDSGSPMTVSNADTSTTTTSYMPAYCLYDYSYTEQIILADDLLGIGDIKALMYKPTNTTSNTYYTNCEIYMANVSINDLNSGFVQDLSVFELVYTGSLNWTDAGWQTIILDDPFAYDGSSNLLIAIRRNHGDWASSSSFAAYNAGASLARYVYRDDTPYTIGSISGGYTSSTVAWYKLIGCEGSGDVCYRVRDIVASNITSDGMTLSWTDTLNSGASYTIYNMSDSSVIATGVTGTSYDIYYLNPNTLYTFGVVADCGTTTASFAKITARTACGGSTAVPYTEDFEGIATGAMPNCWLQVMTGNSGSGTFPSAYNYSTNARNGSVYFEFESTSGATEVAAMPVMDNISSLRLRFYASMSSSYPCTLEVGVLEDTVFVPVDTVSITTFSGTSSWHNNYNQYTVFFTDYSGSGDRIAMRATGTAGSQYTLMLDDFEVGVADAPEITYLPANLSTNINTDLVVTATVGGDPTSMVYTWSSVMADAGNATMTTMANELTINYNTAGIDTVTLIASNTAGEDTAMLIVRALDLSPVTVFPYTTGFEEDDDLNWQLFNDATNAWVIDTAVNNTADGNTALYISNDNGVSNAYTINVSQFSYAYRTFQFDETGEYAISFDWRGYGEGSWDYLRTWIAPVTANIESGHLPDGTTGTSAYQTTTPAGWIDLGGKKNLQSDWQNLQTTFTITTAGTYNLVFMWANDGSSGTQPPAAVDNISINALSCSAVASITLDSISDSEMAFHWSPVGTESEWRVVIDDTIDAIVIDTTYFIDQLSANTNYNVSVYAVCGYEDTSFATTASFRTPCGSINTLPWTEGFEGLPTSVAPTCWTAGFSGNPRVMTSSPHTGSQHLYFSGSTATLIALPPFSDPVNTLQVRLWTRPESFSSSSCGTFSVGYMTDPSRANSFVAVQTWSYDDFSAYEEKEVSMASAPDSAILIAFRHNANSTAWYWYVDDVTVETIPACTHPDAVSATAVSATDVDVVITGDATADHRIYWSNGTTTDSADVNGSTYTITGLTGGTGYTISVGTICDDGSVSSLVSTSVRTMCSDGGCDLVINMVDSYGDGWNGNAIVGYSGGAEVFNATITSGSTNTLTYNMCSNETVVMLWVTGSYPSEASFTITAGGDDIAMGTGSYFSTDDTVGVAIGCPSCIRPTTISATATSDSDIDVTLTGDPTASYRIYWTAGTTTDSATITGLTHTITGLTASTTYTIAAATICDDGSLSNTISTTERTQCLGGGCYVEIEMEDSYGDGWNGNAIDVYVNNALVTSATIDDGYNATFSYSICLSDTVTLIWQSGSYSDETSFSITIGGEDILIDAEGDTYSTGDTLSYTIGCPSCPKPTNLVISDVSSTSATISWTAGASESSWQVSLNGAAPVTASTNSYTFNGLTALTNYTVSIVAICGPDENSFALNGSFSTAMCDGATIAENFDSTITGSTSSYLPLGTSFYNYGFTQTIISATDLAGLGTEINAMAFSSASATQGNYYTHMTVYLANVTESDLSAGFILPSDSGYTFTTVIDDGDFCYSDAGWHTQGFNTPFTWDGTSNILVTINRAHGSYSSGASFTAHTGNTARYVYRDSSPYTFADVASLTSSNTSSTVGDLRLISCGAGCAMPSNLTTTNTYNSVTASWQNADIAEVAIVTGLWNGDAGVSTQIVTTNSITFDGLTPNTQYTVAVRQLCDDGMTSNWELSTITTDDLPCFAPGTPVVSNVTYSTADIAWTAGGEEAAWEVHVFNTTYDLYDTVDAMSYQATGLTAGISYNVAVSALCGNNYERMSEASDTVSFTMQTCAVPTNVTVTGITTNSAIVNWTSTGATKYEIEYGFSGFNQGEGTMVVVENATSHTINGLSQNTEYDVYVRAFCSETLISTWSDVKSFTTTQTGISDVMNSNVSLYPNPASQTVTISGFEGEATVSIVDLNGREVYSTTANGTVTVDVTGYAQGAYFVRIAGENTVAIRKLIVK